MIALLSAHDFLPTDARRLRPRRRWLAIALAIGAAWFAAVAVQAAELRLRAQCAAEGAVVKLGDVAEIFAADRRQADRLAAIELFPAPAASATTLSRRPRVARLAGVAGRQPDASMRSPAAARCRAKANARPSQTQAAPNLSPTIARKINQRVCEAVVQYLKEHASAHRPWIVEAELSDAEARVVADAARH